MLLVPELTIVVFESFTPWILSLYYIDGSLELVIPRVWFDFVGLLQVINILATDDTFASKHCNY